MADETPKPRPPFYRDVRGLDNYGLTGRAADPRMREHWGIGLSGWDGGWKTMDPTKPPLEKAATEAPNVGDWHGREVYMDPEEYAQFMGHPPSPGSRGIITSGRYPQNMHLDIHESLPPHLREAVSELKRLHPEIVLAWDSRRSLPYNQWYEQYYPDNKMVGNVKFLPAVAEGLHYLGGLINPAMMLYQVRQEANQRERDIEWAKRPRGRQGPTYLSEGKPQPRQADGAWIDNSAVERQRAMRRYTQSTRNN